MGTGEAELLLPYNRCNRLYNPHQRVQRIQAAPKFLAVAHPIPVVIGLALENAQGIGCRRGGVGPGWSPARCQHKSPGALGRHGEL